MMATFSSSVAAPESCIIICFTVKTRNMSVVLLFTFLVCTDWLEIWLVFLLHSFSWRLMLFFFCDDCCWSELQRAADKISWVLCILRILFLLPLVSLTAGSFHIVIPVLHDCSLCDMLGVVIPCLVGCDCCSLEYSPSSVSLGTHNGSDQPHITGSGKVACITHRCDQNADNCRTVSAHFGICTIHPGPRYMASGLSTQKLHRLHWKHCIIIIVYQPLHSNGSLFNDIIACLLSAWQCFMSLIKLFNHATILLIFDLSDI